MRLPRVFLTSLLLLSSQAALAQGQKAGLLSGPYVIAPTADGGTVCWQTTAEAPGAVRVKADSAGDWTEVKEPKPAQFHSVKLSGLPEANAYQVQVFAGEQKLGELTFRAASKKADTFAFFAYGDTRSHPASHTRVITAMLAESQRLKQSTFVLHTGDLADSDSNESQTAREFFWPAEPILARMPFIPVRGNHEDYTPDLFSKYFPEPARSKAAAGGDDYCIDYGSVRIVVLDKYSPKSALDARMKWVGERLAEANDRWRVLTLHEPMYSSGPHGSATTTRGILEPILVAGKVHLVLAGHDHDYERTKPIKGITHIVTGGGGAPLRSFDKDHTGDWSVKFVRTLHFLTVSVTPEKLTIRAFGPKGGNGDWVIFDTVEIPKDCGWPKP